MPVFEQEFCKTSLVSAFASWTKWTSALCDWLVSSFRVYLVCVTTGMVPTEATAVEKPHQAEMFLMVLYPTAVEDL